MGKHDAGKMFEVMNVFENFILMILIMGHREPQLRALRVR